MDPTPGSTRVRTPLVTASVVCLVLGAAVRLPVLGARGPWADGRGDTSLLLLAAAAGVLAAPLAAIVAAELVGPEASLWAGGLVALSPIHALASREAGPEALLVLGLLVALWLLAALDRHGHRLLAVALGLAVGGLVTCGVAAFATAGILPLLFLASRPDRRSAAKLAAGVSLAVVAAASLAGLARSPFDYGEIPPWIPATTLEGILRCAGASFTRVIGLEYQLVVSHARWVLPISALFVALMVRGALGLPARTRALLVAGALLPFALGAAMAVILGRVTPLQASRLVAALPFVALLMATSLASLSGRRAWAVRSVVGVTLGGFLALALAR